MRFTVEDKLPANLVDANGIVIDTEERLIRERKAITIYFSISKEEK